MEDIIIGALLLFWIGVKLLQPEGEGHGQVAAATFAVRRLAFEFTRLADIEEHDVLVVKLGFHFLFLDLQRS